MGAIFKIPGYILYFIGGFWGLFICIGIVHSKLGVIGVLVSLFLFPVTAYLAPWYVGFMDDNWKPVLVIYGSGILAIVLVGIGTLIDKD